MGSGKRDEPYCTHGWQCIVVDANDGLLNSVTLWTKLTKGHRCFCGCVYNGNLPQAIGDVMVQRVWILFNTEDDEAVMFYTERPQEEFKGRFTLKAYDCTPVVEVCDRSKQSQSTL